MDKYNKDLIDEFIDKIKKRRVKSFYPQSLAKSLSLDVEVASEYLNQFSKESGKITAKYEVRCPDCLDIIEEYEHMPNIDMDDYIECESCNSEIIIGSSSIYIKYCIN